MRYILLSIFVFCSLFAKADLGGFTYDKVEYEAVVHENNVWDVKETYYIDFTEPRHGFYRYLKNRFVVHHPMPEKGLDSDGKVYTDEYWYNTTLTNLTVEGGPLHDFTTEDNNYIIQIGDADNTVIGKQKYVISYSYAFSDDRLHDRDFIFYSILGPDFNELIKRFEFNIYFDKPLPQSALDGLKVISGLYGDNGNVANVTMENSPRYISGYADDIQPNHAVTLFTYMDEGYFVGVPQKNLFSFYVCLGGALLSLMALLVSALIVRRKPVFVKSIEFYPPEGISSAEVGVIIDDTVDKVDVASLIPWFASKGYIRLKDTSEEKTLTLIKKKGLPNDAPEYQKKLWKLLFHNRTNICLKDIGEKPEEMKEIDKSLKDHFSEENGRQLQKESPHFYWYIPLFIFSTLLMALNTREEGDFFGDISLVAFYWALPFCCGFFLRWAYQGSDIITSKKMRFVMITLKTLVMSAVMLLCVALFVCPDAPMNQNLTAVFWVACFVAVEMLGCFYTDTDYRLKMIGKLLGFREFIETAEMPKLKMLVDEDPEYFFKVLPYAMVFGLTNKWADLFKDINVEKPSWYETSSDTGSYFFAHSFAKTIESSTNSAITAISHDSSSSGSGGGGFSGGGGGGGGGGSW